MKKPQASLFPTGEEAAGRMLSPFAFLGAVAAFGGKDRATRIATLATGAGQILTFANEFWTARQRAASSLHEVSFRACFKPQLPRFFIERLTSPGEAVYDPFMGRGTTPLEAALLGRVPMGGDANPLCEFLVRPRLTPPTLAKVEERLSQVDFLNHDEYPEELLTFYHPETLREICALKMHLLTRQRERRLDTVDEWIRMVAMNRLTGHSAGFFSVYTLPPNQAVTVEAQKKINRARGQEPPRRQVPAILLKKTRTLLADCDGAARAVLRRMADQAEFHNGHAARTPGIRSGSVALVVTSPPFLDVVDYAGDNWLRGWFAGVDIGAVKLDIHRKLPDWAAAMTGVFRELRRVLRPGGYVAFEVGEVRGGKVRLEETVVPCGAEAGLTPVCVMLNEQRFTKTANCWGVTNDTKGTNTNRIVVFQKT